jgi:hypothetical protein
VFGSRCALPVENGATPPSLQTPTVRLTDPDQVSKVFSSSASAGGSEPETDEEGWSLWMAPDGRRRVEFATWWGGERLIVVYHGRSWQSWSHSRGFLSNAGRDDYEHHGGPADALINLSKARESLSLETTGEGLLLGRAVVHLRGVPRPQEGSVTFNDTPWHSNAGFGADEYFLSIDLSSGILLRAEARHAGRRFRVIEVTEFALNEVFGSDVFDIRRAARI